MDTALKLITNSVYISCTCFSCWIMLQILLETTSLWSTAWRHWKMQCWPTEHSEHLQHRKGYTHNNVKKITLETVRRRKETVCIFCPIWFSLHRKVLERNESIFDLKWPTIYLLEVLSFLSRMKIDFFIIVVNVQRVHLTKMFTNFIVDRRTGLRFHGTIT